MGAAPITLINGETLIDLLVHHEMGLRRRPWTTMNLMKQLSRYSRTMARKGLAK
jgi:hypothetical protein